MDDNLKSRHNPESRIIAGLILVGVGAALLLRNSGFPLPYWLFSWPMILILVGIYSGAKHNFRNNTWLILIAIGGFFMVDRFAPEIKLAANFWPAIIIGVGILFILRPDRRRWIHIGDNEKKNDDLGLGQKTTYQAGSSSYTTDASDFLKTSSIFSGVQRNIVSKNFQGGRISCVFGGADIDLTQADIQGTKEIRLEVIFGGVKIIVPPHWTVHNETDGVFHGVEDKRKFRGDATTSDKILVLRGSVIFGGVEIKSY
ncbi:MAG: cell wall-active antibiotics response protein [Bacteroidetes bacterium]|nr:cell wall-active antibiotics response protein [Bacteroidota bacterium]